MALTFVIRLQNRRVQMVASAFVAGGNVMVTWIAETVVMNPPDVVSEMKSKIEDP